MLEINVALIAAILGVLIPLITIIVKASNLLRYVEGRLDGLKTEQKLLEHQINSILSLIDYRLRDLERYTEDRTDFIVRYKRDENTGSPFLGKD